MKQIKGTKLVECRTLGSMYDNNCVEFTDDKGNDYRMKAEQIIRMVNDFNFDVKTAKKYSYLETQV